MPKRDEEDTHEPRAPYDEELEKTFKKRARVQVDVPQEVLDIAKQYQEEESTECKEAATTLEKELAQDDPAKGDDDDDSQ